MLWIVIDEGILQLFPKSKYSFNFSCPQQIITQPDSTQNYSRSMLYPTSDPKGPGSDGLIRRVLNMICAHQLEPVISEQHWWSDLKLEQELSLRCRVRQRNETPATMSKISHCKRIEINIHVLFHFVALWKSAFKQWIHTILCTVTSNRPYITTVKIECFGHTHQVKETLKSISFQLYAKQNKYLCWRP